MNQRDDFLVELLTEELPPKSLLTVAKAFREQIIERLQKEELAFDEVDFFATPRRLAVLVKNLNAETPDQVVLRKGPALTAAFDKNGLPSPACVGFARSFGITPDKLEKIETPQGAWMGYTQKIPGVSVKTLLPALVEQAALALPIPKRMRWGECETQFIRPLHSVILLYGDQVVDGVVLGCEANRLTRGHRFHESDWITIPHADAYVSLLETAGHVIVDFAKRREMIREEAQKCVKEGEVFFSDALLDEVTGLVEWPEALCGQFDKAFLDLPKEVLVSSMQDHQRYFPVIDAKQQLLPYFVTISNIQSHDPKRVIQGNERVLRARLADAAFFYATDKQESLMLRLERLKGIIFQAKLGTLYDKAERLSKAAEYIAKKINLNPIHAARSGMLAKTDLTTNMVNEFPELQGVMGYYYALNDKEADDVAIAIKEQYLPRFAGDVLPASSIGQILSLADKLDTLVGTFGISQIPTGDKDPFGLRRATLGVLRIIIENKINLDLNDVLIFIVKAYGNKLENQDVVPQILNFIQERLRAWYLDQGIAADVFAAVAAIGITNPLDAHERIKAVQAFKGLNSAETLSVANKRVSNILSKYTETIEAKTIDPQFFENEAEQVLANQLEIKSQTVMSLYDQGHYDQVLAQLADLHKPIDDFFEQVMVMTEDKKRRENRLLLLTKLRALFLQVADIALLQQEQRKSFP